MALGPTGGSAGSLLSAFLLLPGGEMICTLTEVLDISVPGRGQRFLARAPKALSQQALPDATLTVQMHDGRRLLVSITYVSLSIDQQSSIVLGKIHS